MYPNNRFLDITHNLGQDQLHKPKLNNYYSTNSNKGYNNSKLNSRKIKFLQEWQVLLTIISLRDYLKTILLLKRNKKFRFRINHHSMELLDIKLKTRNKTTIINNNSNNLKLQIKFQLSRNFNN